MKNETVNKIVLRFDHDSDGIAVYCNGCVTIAELEAAIESLGGILDHLLELQEQEFLKQMKLAYKDMVKGE